MISKPLVSVSDVRPLLPIRAGMEDYDARIAGLILTATRDIERAIDRRLTRQVFTQTFPTYDAETVSYDFNVSNNESGLLSAARTVRYNLLGCDVLASPEVEVYYDRAEAFAAETVLRFGIDYFIRPAADQGYLELRYPTRESPGGLKVTYTAGYEVDTASDSLRLSAPDDLRTACQLQVLFLWNRTTSDNVGMDVDRAQGKNSAAKFRVRAGLTPEAAAMVAPYRQPKLSRA